MQYTIVGDASGQNITVYAPGRGPLVAHSSHPNFEAIVAKAKADDPTVVDLFDVAFTVGQKFENLTDRITTSHGKLYLDGIEMVNALTTKILNSLRAGLDDWQPLVLFMEKLVQNPSDYSREQLYDWLNAEDFTITDDGDIVGYKSVTSTDVEGVYNSTMKGNAVVDGVGFTDAYIPNKVGSVVTMPRNTVAFEPNQACSYGLHVGTHQYAKGYSGDYMLEVHVNPRDVVSVPNDTAGKMRVCRYKVARVIGKRSKAEKVTAQVTPKAKRVTTAFKVTIKAAKEAVKAEGNIDRAAKRLGVNRDKFRAFAKEKNITTPKATR